MSNDEIMAEAKAIVNKWLLDDTHHKLADRNLSDTPPNHLCLSVIPVAHTYCMAALELADNGYVLPAMALLRVLAELTYRTIWCLGETSEKPKVKIERWLKHSYNKRKELLEDMVKNEGVPDNDKEQFRQEIATMTEEIGQIHHKPSGSIARCVKELPVIAQDLFAHLYSTMHRAIHPDLIVLGDTIKQEGDELFSLGDWKHIPKATLARNCIHLAFQLAVHVQAYQELDTEATKAEYDTTVALLDGGRLQGRQA